ncbi:molybdenum ABC transporter, periplasmic molybdate-binding protein [Novosphingobium nitrogenifigens DSM 19370]|uniref:Molybdenum ABC transporter, periplasmic molybdate-binding protein n=1 Tax=Novosphingobium nitrogenifigens DSM 19370 TaxID=983920 RepID=F1Z796_9SPHN|nr:molybdate ABC transporter substrate-binding protein [Novosphingobium nitrogenifigens]EGD59514.1 molybdenum ABC transporter, periplasmic molybdate-binding protein [Novosphingobium nitrogenifigens DSM 19370]
MTRLFTRRDWLAFAAVAVAGLAGTGAHAQARPPVVLAAASMQESLNKAADAWVARGHPRPVLSFAASSALARQIVNGAPADLFVSADEEWMDYVAHAPGRPGGWIKPGTRANFLTNGLALIAPAGSPVRLSIRRGFPLAQALGPNGRLATGQVGAVPAGKYAKEALTNLGVWPSVAGRIAGAESVRAALALVARGETPLGIVYATDAAVEPKVRVVGLFPPQSHGPIVYPIVGIAGSTNPEGEGFRRFLLSREGHKIFLAYGFGPR